VVRLELYHIDQSLPGRPTKLKGCGPKWPQPGPTRQINPSQDQPALGGKPLDRAACRHRRKYLGNRDGNLVQSFK
jgi:hypothetical protein